MGCGQNQSTNDKTAKSDSTRIDSAAIQTARQAFIFSLPLVLMDITRTQFTHSGFSDMAAPPNTFYHVTAFPDATFRNVVRPNADTYYSSAILDLTPEPVVLSVPNTGGRYYMMPMLDAYTNVFSSPGTRTTGNNAANFLVTGPGWKGNVPTGLKQIQSPTNMVWIIGRTQVNSKEDGMNVVMPLQKKYHLAPLSSWNKTYTPPALSADTSVPKGGPNEIVMAMAIDQYFNRANRMMTENPPAADDASAIAKFAAIGVGPGKQFDLASFNDATKEALKKIPMEVLDQLKSAMEKPAQLLNGWSSMGDKVGTYGTDYAQRAAVSYGGLGANLREDAVYYSCAVDSNGNKLEGGNKYKIHFEKGQTPPANAFWSVTMYDPDGYMVANPINRNAIGDRSHLRANSDGSIDIYIQHDSPGKEKESNWLPAPAGGFNLLLRVYWPKPSMIDGSWHCPAVKKQ